MFRGTTTDLLNSIKTSPGTVNLYVGDELALFGGKPKSTQSFPFPPEIMYEFVEEIQTLQQKSQYSSILASIENYKARHESLLFFLHTYRIKGVTNTNLVNLVLSAMIKLFENHPGSILHEFMGLHQLRNAFNFNKKPGRREVRDGLIAKEREIFQKIQEIHFLLENNLIEKTI